MAGDRRTGEWGCGLHPSILLAISPQIDCILVPKATVRQPSPIAAVNPQGAHYPLLIMDKLQQATWSHMFLDVLTLDKAVTPICIHFPHT